MELVDTPDLGSGGESYGGSSPSARTILGYLFPDTPENAENECKNDYAGN